MVYYIFSAGIMHFYNSTYDESLALTAKAHLVRCLNALKEMQITWGAAARQRELLVGFLDTQDLDNYANLDLPGMMDNRGRKREAENQDVESLPGSGRVTPHSRGTPMDIMAHFSSNPPRGPFATASIGQMSAGNPQPPAPVRRNTSQTSQKNQAASKRRHNSISAAGLRHSANQAAMQHAPADMRINTSNTNNSISENTHNNQTGMSTSASSSLFPQSDFTFVSPSAPTAPLPLPSPSWGKVNGFEFANAAPAPPTGTSPSSAFFNFASPPMIPPASDFASHDNQHISNILGLTNPNDFLSANAGQAQNRNEPNINQPMDLGHDAARMTDGNLNNSNSQQGQNPANMFNPNDLVFGQQLDAANQPRFGDIAEFLFDPFWQSQMRQMVHGDAQNGMVAGTAGFTTLPEVPTATGPMFSDTPASDLFSGYVEQRPYVRRQYMLTSYFCLSPVCQPSTIKMIGAAISLNTPRTSNSLYPNTCSGQSKVPNT